MPPANTFTGAVEVIEQDWFGELLDTSDQSPGIHLRVPDVNYVNRILRLIIIVDNFEAATHY